MPVKTTRLSLPSTREWAAQINAMEKELNGHTTTLHKMSRLLESVASLAVTSSRLSRPVGFPRLLCSIYSKTDCLGVPNIPSIQISPAHTDSDIDWQFTNAGIVGDDSALVLIESHSPLPSENEDSVQRAYKLRPSCVPFLFSNHLHSWPDNCYGIAITTRHGRDPVEEMRLIDAAMNTGRPVWGVTLPRLDTYALLSEQDFWDQVKKISSMCHACLYYDDSLWNAGQDPVLPALAAELLAQGDPPLTYLTNLTTHRLTLCMSAAYGTSQPAAFVSTPPPNQPPIEPESGIVITTGVEGSEEDPPPFEPLDLDADVDNHLVSFEVPQSPDCHRVVVIDGQAELDEFMADDNPDGTQLVLLPGTYHPILLEPGTNNTWIRGIGEVFIRPDGGFTPALGFGPDCDRIRLQDVTIQPFTNHWGRGVSCSNPNNKPTNLVLVGVNFKNLHDSLFFAGGVDGLWVEECKSEDVRKYHIWGEDFENVMVYDSQFLRSSEETCIRLYGQNKVNLVKLIVRTGPANKSCIRCDGGHDVAVLQGNFDGPIQFGWRNPANGQEHECFNFKAAYNLIANQQGRSSIDVQPAAHNGILLNNNITSPFNDWSGVWDGCPNVSWSGINFNGTPQPNGST